MVDNARKSLRSFTVLIAFGVLAVANETARAEMQPLEDIIETENSISMTLYAFTRCAALYNATSALFAKEKDAGEVSRQHEAMANYMMAEAKKWVETRKIPITMEQRSKDIEKIQSAYVERWDINYVETGHRFGDLTKQDYLLCWDIQPPSASIKKVIPNERFPN